MVAGESGLHALFHAYAAGRERHRVRPVTGEGVDVGVCGRDAVGVGDF